jgi:hypothetical protein
MIQATVSRPSVPDRGIMISWLPLVFRGDYLLDASVGRKLSITQSSALLVPES